MGATGIGIWERDLVRHTSFGMKPRSAIFGYNAAALSDYSEIFLQRVHPDDLERIKEATRQAIAGTADYNTEFRVIWPDASLHVLAARATVLRDDRGQPTRMIGTCWDITDTKQREQLAHLGSEVGDALTALQTHAGKTAIVRRSPGSSIGRGPGPDLDSQLNRTDVLEMQASAGMHTQTDGTRSRIPVGQVQNWSYRPGSPATLFPTMWVQSPMSMTRNGWNKMVWSVLSVIPWWWRTGWWGSWRSSPGRN